MLTKLMALVENVIDIFFGSTIFTCTLIRLLVLLVDLSCNSKECNGCISHHCPGLASYILHYDHTSIMKLLEQLSLSLCSHKNSFWTSSVKLS